jgi:hypothetical protein
MKDLEMSSRRSPIITSDYSHEQARQPETGTFVMPPRDLPIAWF